MSSITGRFRALRTFLIIGPLIAFIPACEIDLRREPTSTEMNAIRGIHAIHTAQVQYYSQFGRYAANLAELGPPADGSPGQQAADLLPRTLAEGRHSGYVFTLRRTPAGYAVNVNPEVFGGSGRRTFYSDETQVIRQNWTQEPATADSPELR